MNTSTYQQTELSFYLLFSFLLYKVAFQTQTLFFNTHKLNETFCVKTQLSLGVL